MAGRTQLTASNVGVGHRHLRQARMKVSWRASRELGLAVWSTWHEMVQACTMNSRKAKA